MYVLTCVPPSVVADVDTNMNSMSGQSSDWLPYLVVKKPTASRPMLDVKGPSPKMAYLHTDSGQYSCDRGPLRKTHSWAKGSVEAARTLGMFSCPGS